jgi:hypothetical protein
MGLLDARSGAWTRAHCTGQYGPVLISTAHKVAYCEGCGGTGKPTVPVGTGRFRPVLPARVGVVGVDSAEPGWR